MIERLIESSVKPAVSKADIDWLKLDTAVPT
jgi:hypothetical protein